MQQTAGCQAHGQTYENEWAMAFPQFAVSRWIGHSITVSGRHYANAVPDELFDQAAGVGQSGIGAMQNPARQSAERTRNDLKSTEGDLVGCGADSGDFNRS